MRNKKFRSIYYNQYAWENLKLVFYTITYYVFTKTKLNFYFFQERNNKIREVEYKNYLRNFVWKVYDDK